MLQRPRNGPGGTTERFAAMLLPAPALRRSPHDPSHRRAAHPRHAERARRAPPGDPARRHQGRALPAALQVAGALQHTQALWDLDVALPAEQKGTHMSRFVAWLNDIAALEQPLDADALRQQLAAMLDRLHAREGRLDARFSFFLRKRAPVSGVQSLLDYQGRWIAERRGGPTSVWAEVAVPVKSLCPCSKEISEYGAHNQRSLVTVRAELLQPVPWHELVRFAEEPA